MSFGVFRITPVFEKKSKPHGAEYCRHKSLRCPREVTSISGVGIIITGMLLQWFVKRHFRPWAKKTRVAHRSAQKSHCFCYPSCTFSAFSNWYLLRRLFKLCLIQKLSSLFMKPVSTWKVWSFLFHHCGACVRSWFLCLLGLCFWFCKAETVYLERGGKCVCKSVPLQPSGVTSVTPATNSAQHCSCFIMTGSFAAWSSWLSLLNPLRDCSHLIWFVKIHRRNGRHREKNI